MKKLFALTMVLALCLCSFAALAEAPAELNWSDFQAITDSVEGDFYSFSDYNLQIWVPGYFQEGEIGDEEATAGIIGYMTTPDGAYSMVIQDVDVNGMSIDEYADALAQVEGVSGIEKMTVNGLAAVGYDITDRDVSTMAFTTESGRVLEFSFSPISDEGFAQMATCMTASIQSIQ